MIKICYPPGTYGTYLARCIYHYTNLSQGLNQKFDFDQYGSSHSFESNSVIQLGHVGNDVTFDIDDSTVVILPCESQRLDYFNNAFMKYYKGDLISNLRDTFGPQGLDEIDHKLRESWSHTGGLSLTTPQWMVREFCSLWFSQFLNNCFSLTTYQLVPNKLCITTNDILSDYQNTVLKVIDVLHLQSRVTHFDIAHNHQTFLNAQKYIGSQRRCKQWCDHVLEGIESATPCRTIFDEVYVQDYLRTKGFEIECDGLDVFPLTSTALSKIIYKA